MLNKDDFEKLVNKNLASRGQPPIADHEKDKLNRSCGASANATHIMAERIPTGSSQPPRSVRI